MTAAVSENMLPSLNLDYDLCLQRLRSKREWLRSPEAQAAFAGLAERLKEFGQRPRIALYGSSWSGYMAANLLEQANAGAVELVFESSDPLPELAHLPHRNLLHGDARDSADCVLLATAPRHYPFIEPLVRAKVDAPLVVGMYAPQKPEIPLPEPDSSLGVRTRVGTAGVEARLPLHRSNLALVLIDLWDLGRPSSPYDDCIPELLALARRHDLTVIHAPSYKLKPGGGFVTKSLETPVAASQEWPPLEFRNRQGRFGHCDHTARRLKAGDPRPLGLLDCAMPVDRPNEYVESSLEGVLEILERRRILYPLYAGGGTLQCLVFKPAGYLNLARHGYQPILVRDATADNLQEVDGALVDMQAAGVACFENLCGLSTTITDLRDALDAPSAGRERS
ncbi:cysteine hydrolase family protein [Paucidesulfovibrio longus]|uniref:hypothetical protein n=1 Tax=Paucidesulfovibrio longus TaxID=889 RepID=UPI0003B44102|nr:hypothetical protein [Paucidesulfovibrio longus]